VRSFNAGLQFVGGWLLVQVSDFSKTEKAPGHKSLAAFRTHGKRLAAEDDVVAWRQERTGHKEHDYKK
jgi:hypothetical protein